MLCAAKGGQNRTVPSLITSPRPPKEPDLSAPGPPSAKSMAPDRAHYVSVQQGRKRFTHLSHAANTRQSHVLVKFDMMLAGLDQPKGLNDFCSKAENIKNK